MIKFTKVFVKIIFYVLSILFGVILLLTLPYVFLNFELSNKINDSLEEYKYVEAMNTIGCYYDEEIAFLYEDTKNDVQLVLFRATPFVESSYSYVEESGNQAYITTQETIEIGYYGFLCNVDKKYVVNSSKDDGLENKTKLVVNDDKVINLLDFDDNNDEVNDTILTLSTGSYVTFTISKKLVDSIEKIEFIDKNGESFIQINTTKLSNTPLDFNHKFFKDFENFVTEFNVLIENKTLGKITQEEIKTEQTKLAEKVKEILDSNQTYKVGYYDVSIKDAQVKAYSISAAYFVVIFVLGDFLVGKRFILNFFKRLFKNINKKQTII